MKVLFFILMGVLLISTIAIILSSDDDKLNSFFCEVYKITITGLLFYGIIGFINWNTPTAMNVYQGKTTLEITYKDSVAIDSVVVFKNKEKQQ